MTLVLVIVLIALAFGFVFAKLDSVVKCCKRLQTEIDEINGVIQQLKIDNKK